MSTDQTPGLLTSHAQYVKGVAEEAIGNLTSSTAWVESGKHDKEEAVANMRVAHGEPATDGRSKGALETEGKIEKAAGWATGCAGMQHDGERKVQAALEN